MAIVKPEISIITPVWNGLPFIKESVDSVLSQDYQNWELLISDNGSTDGTREYLDTLKDPRIRVFKQDVNLGIGGNFNFLFLNAAAPNAYCLCADDYFLPGTLSKVVQEWNSVSADTAVICFDWKWFLTHSALTRYGYTVVPENLLPENALLAFFLFGNLPGNISNVSLKVSVINHSGGFAKNYKMAGDFEMWARLSKGHRFVLSEFKPAYVRRHEATASNYLNSKGGMFNEVLMVYENLIKELSTVYDHDELIAYFNIEVSAFHLREAIKAAMYGRFKKLKSFMDTHSSILWPKWKQMSICLPLALLEGVRLRLLVSMARKYYKVKS